LQHHRTLIEPFSEEERRFDDGRERDFGFAVGGFAAVAFGADLDFDFDLERLFGGGGFDVFFCGLTTTLVGPAAAACVCLTSLVEDARVSSCRRG